MFTFCSLYSGWGPAPPFSSISPPCRREVTCPLLPPRLPGVPEPCCEGGLGTPGGGGAGCWRLVSPNGRCRLGRQQATLRKRGGNNFGKGGAGCGHAGLEAGRPRPSSRLPPPAVPGAVEPWRCPCPCRCRYRCWCWCWGGSWRAAGPGPSRARPRGSGKGAPCSTGTARAASLGRPSPTTAPTSASASWRRGRRSSPARSRWSEGWGRAAPGRGKGGSCTPKARGEAGMPGGRPRGAAWPWRDGGAREPPPAPGWRGPGSRTVVSGEGPAGSRPAACLLHRYCSPQLLFSPPPPLLLLLLLFLLLLLPLSLHLPLPFIIIII